MVFIITHTTLAFVTQRVGGGGCGIGLSNGFLCQIYKREGGVLISPHYPIVVTNARVVCVRHSLLRLVPLREIVFSHILLVTNKS